jgi:hypothetical protein
VPVILRVGPYRIYFFSHEPNEPPHVHARRNGRTAKFWLAPVRVARNQGFSPVELRRIERIVEKNEEKLLQTWRAHFD